MAELKASPRKKSLGAVSDALRSARGFGDRVSLPLVGGLGSFLLQKIPEEINEWSYGNAPMQITPQGDRLPKMKRGRGQQVADTAFLGLDLAGARGLASLVGRPLARAMENSPLTKAAQFVGEQRTPVSALTVWHGSPHKFDKFSMDKIGTGEGAQVKGHGLYFAEAPEVARTYSADRAYVGKVMDGKSHNVDFNSPQWIAQNSADEMGGADAAISHLGKVLNQRRGLKAPGQAESNAQVQAAIDLLKSGQIATKGHLYKADIPDEAVARFLDWDKPLSQQAPEVQAFARSKEGLRLFNVGQRRAGLRPLHEIPEWMTGEDLIRGAGLTEGSASDLGRMGSDVLQKQGISGIRYLDSGSRSAGQGSSNFVLFDDQMARILERNGIQTGELPWKPGEYRLP
jgi:hypothetical protein